MTYDERKVEQANRIAQAQSHVQFILYYPKGQDPPEVNHPNVDFKASPFAEHGHFLMHAKELQNATRYDSPSVVVEMAGQTTVYDHNLVHDPACAVALNPGLVSAWMFCKCQP